MKLVATIKCEVCGLQTGAEVENGVMRVFMGQNEFVAACLHTTDGFTCPNWDAARKRAERDLRPQFRQ